MLRSIAARSSDLEAFIFRSQLDHTVIKALAEGRCEKTVPKNIICGPIGVIVS